MKQKDIPASGGYEEGQEYTVQTKEVLKGNQAKTFIIFSENSSGRFSLSTGSSYVLFIYKEMTRYHVNNCGNSGLLSEKKDVLQIVRPLKVNKK